MEGDKEIFLVSQLDPAEDDPGQDSLYDTGVIAVVLQLLKLPDGTVRVLVEGKQRARLEIGRASCRERVCPYVSISVVPVFFKKKHHPQPNSSLLFNTNCLHY